MNTQHPILQTLTERITSELRPVDREAAFDAYLDDQGPVNVAGLEFDPSRIWKEMDPITYRCGVNDFADSEAWVEIDGETYDQGQVEDLVRDFREQLESELCDLENELEEAQEELDNLKDAADLVVESDFAEQQQAVDALKQQITEKQAEIAAIEKDDFFN